MFNTSRSEISLLSPSSTRSFKSSRGRSSSKGRSPVKSSTNKVVQYTENDIERIKEKLEINVQLYPHYPGCRVINMCFEEISKESIGNDNIDKIYLKLQRLGQDFDKYIDVYNKQRSECISALEDLVLTYKQKIEKFPYLDTNQNDLLLSQIQRLTKDPVSQTPISEYNTSINKLSIAIGKLKPLPEPKAPTNPITNDQAMNLQYLENQLIDYMYQYPHYEDIPRIESYIEEVKNLNIGTDLYGSIYNQLNQYYHRFEKYVERYLQDRKQLIIHLQSLLRKYHSRFHYYHLTPNKSYTEKILRIENLIHDTSINSPITDYQNAIQEITEMILSMSPSKADPVTPKDIFEKTGVMMSMNSSFSPSLTKVKEDKLVELKSKLSDFMLRYPHYPNVNSIISYISLLSSNVIPNQEYDSIYRNLESLIQEYRIYIHNYIEVKTAKIAELKSLLSDYNDKIRKTHTNPSVHQSLIDDVLLLIHNDTINYSIENYNHVISKIMTVNNTLDSNIPESERFIHERQISYSRYNDFRKPLEMADNPFGKLSTKFSNRMDPTHVVITTNNNKQLQRSHSFSTSTSISSTTKSPIKIQRSENGKPIKMEEEYKSELTPNTSLNSIQKKKYENPVLKDKLVNELKQKLFFIHDITDTNRKLYNRLRIPTSVFNPQTLYLIRGTNLYGKTIKELRERIRGADDIIEQIKKIKVTPPEGDSKKQSNIFSPIMNNSSRKSLKTSPSNKDSNNNISLLSKRKNTSPTVTLKTEDLLQEKQDNEINESELKPSNMFGTIPELSDRDKLIKQCRQNLAYIHSMTDSDSRLYNRLAIPYLIISKITAKVIRGRTLENQTNMKLNDIYYDTFDVIKQILTVELDVKVPATHTNEQRVHEYLLHKIYTNLQYAHKHIDNNPVLFQQIIIPYHLVNLSNGTLRPASGLEKELNEKLKRLYNSTIDVMNQVITHIMIPRINNPSVKLDNNDNNNNNTRTTSKRDSIVNVTTPVQSLSQQLVELGQVKYKDDKLYYQLDIPPILIHPISKEIWSFLPAQYNTPERINEMQRAVNYVNRQIKRLKPTIDPRIIKDNIQRQQDNSDIHQIQPLPYGFDDYASHPDYNPKEVEELMKQLKEKLSFIHTLRKVNPSIFNNIKLPQALVKNDCDLIQETDLETFPVSYLRLLKENLESIIKQLSDLKISN